MMVLRSIAFGILCVTCWFADQTVSAQGFGNPLTFQGLDHNSNQSAVSRALGGTSIGIRNDVSTMFAHPAALQHLQGLQFSVSGVGNYINAEQVQQYSPLKYYSNFSLFMEGLTRQIPNPQYDTINHIPVNAADSVQRPFDNISTNWKHSRSNTAPIQAFAAMPITLGEMKIVAGIGVSEYSNLDWFFQNNNVLSPSVLSPNAYNRTRPINDADSSSIPVQWYQFRQQREGTINGYGGAVSMAISEHLFVGVSAMLLQGSSDDVESRIERGRIRFYQNYFRAESVYYRNTRTGTSDYSGQEISVSGLYQNASVGFGFTLNTPTTITRTYKTIVKTDTAGVSASRSESGKDQMTIPLRGTLGITIALRENIRLNIDYELRPYASAEYKNTTGKTSNPWISSNILHLGAEFEAASWLKLRCGVREQKETFEPEGSALTDEPAGFTSFSLGAGMSFQNVIVNVAYEYGKMKYVDTWSSEVSINSQTRQAVSANVSYEIPW